MAQRRPTAVAPVAEGMVLGAKRCEIGSGCARL